MKMQRQTPAVQSEHTQTLGVSHALAAAYAPPSKNIHIVVCAWHADLDFQSMILHIQLFEQLIAYNLYPFKRIKHPRARVRWW